MLLKNYYYWQQDVLPVRFIDDIFDLVKEYKMRDATTLGYKKSKAALKKQKKNKRDTKVSFLSDPWIFEALNGIVETANQKAGWNFEWDYNEAVQFAKYSSKKYYGWHSDSLENPHIYHEPTSPHKHGKMRKLSTIISLNDSSEYKGGEVEFDFRNSDMDRDKTASNIVKCKRLQKKGTVVTFPSHVWHRVKPVTKGTRYSLVVWHIGWPFK